MIYFRVSITRFSKDRLSSSQQTCLTVISSNMLSVFLTSPGIKTFPVTEICSHSIFVKLTAHVVLLLLKLN